MEQATVDNPILQGSLALDSGVPLYLQLVSLFKRCIANKAIKVGDMIPSELELCNRFGISRTTVTFHGQANHGGTTPMHMRRRSRTPFRFWGSLRRAALASQSADNFGL